MSALISRVSFPLDLHVFSEIIDVRSPAEYKVDRVPGAINLPVLDDEEHCETGRLYRLNSPFEARKRGAALVTANISRHLRQHFADKPRDYHPLVYCWRGGQRSQSFATILSAIGWPVKVIDGGYRTYRRHVVKILSERCGKVTFKVINGLTGSGKTLLLHALRAEGAQILDLEGCANHRGSLFGGDFKKGQPTQKEFESLIAASLQTADLSKPVFVEAESPKIGFANIPGILWSRLKAAEVIEINCPLESRTQYLVDEYVDWQREPDRITTVIERLRPFHPADRVKEWHRFIEERDWQRLTQGLLADHYDRCYGRAGTGHYPLPSSSHELLEHSNEAITTLARRLIEAHTP